MRLFALIIAIVAVVSIAGSVASPPDVVPDPAVVAVDSLRGKVVVLDFWASWCRPCRRSFPWWNGMYERYRESGLEVIGVCVDRDREVARSFLEKYQPGFTIWYDTDAKWARTYSLPAMPSTYIYGRDGRLLTTHVGFRESDAAELEVLIQSALEETSP